MAGAQAPSVDLGRRHRFQSTPARGGRFLDGRSISVRNLFQSTPARGGRSRVSAGCHAAPCRFNPRPHVAGDSILWRPALARRGVSIHARTWRAMLSELQTQRRQPVSIHARTWRAIRIDGAIYEVIIKFQSTPARGGRSCVLRISPLTTLFQSTPARGGRFGDTIRGWKCGKCFNPRPHVAGDVRVGANVVHGRCFNPRPHVAGDCVLRSGNLSPVLFQSTPARGGRSVHLTVPNRIGDGFNPRPHVAGDRLRLDDVSSGARRFNPRPHVAGDLPGGACRSPARRFNPRPHVAGDCC